MFLFKRDFEDITASAYHSDFIKGKQDHVLVDVRTPREFTNGHVPGAINLPLSEIKNRVDELPTDKPIVVICATGNRSQSGAAQIKRAGAEQVYNVQGGTMAWMRAGYKTTKK
jgi:rhodanese-related sulfurtransferase